MIHNTHSKIYHIHQTGDGMLPIFHATSTIYSAVGRRGGRLGWPVLIGWGCIFPVLLPVSAAGLLYTSLGTRAAVEHRLASEDSPPGKEARLDPVCSHKLSGGEKFKNL